MFEVVLYGTGLSQNFVQPLNWIEASNATLHVADGSNYRQISLRPRQARKLPARLHARRDHLVWCVLLLLIHFHLFSD